MKSEPNVFSIAALKRAKTTTWDGVRNYQARNFMTKDMAVGDRILFYHSNADPSGVAGLAEVSATATPDRTQFDRRSGYFEPRASEGKPVWFCVKVRFVERFSRVLSLEDLRAQPVLADMALLRKGQRLSIQPVTAAEYECILHLSRR